MEICFDNIIKFSSPLDNFIIERFFTDDDETQVISEEHKDQIFVFQNEAAKFLWDFEHKIANVEASSKFYKYVEVYDSTGKTIEETKKNLYNFGIPFNSWVFIAEQPHLGFMLTWKMIIKYCSGLFNDDYQQVWDRTLNWKLDFNHGRFTFGRDLIFNSTKESDKLLHSIIEMTNRGRR